MARGLFLRYCGRRIPHTQGQAPEILGKAAGVNEWLSLASTMYKVG
jgi:hypothetical protein